MEKKNLSHNYQENNERELIRKNIEFGKFVNH